MSHKPPKGAPLAKSRTQAAREGSGLPVFAIALGALVAVILIAGIVIAVSGGSDDGPRSGTLAAGDQAFGPVTATGNSLAEFPGNGVEDPAIGQPAPKLEGENPSGEALTIDPAEGPMVVVFLAHWCPHCQAEVPRIVEAAEGSDEIEGVPFVAVLTASEPSNGNWPPGAWLEREEWPAGAMVDTEAEPGSLPVAMAAYGLSGYPYLVAIDGDGNVAARSSGELSPDELRAFFAHAADA